jgi:hypothetical protein
LTRKKTSYTLQRMKTETLTDVITFRVEKSITAKIDRIAIRQGRKRADVVRRIFLKAFMPDTSKGAK